ncbi:MAG: class I SAM-dependent methyltransferase, partial [Phycisphaerae bacterium]
MIRRALRRVQRKAAFRTALDCASGTGRLLPVLAKFDVSVIAMDTAEEMLEEGRRYHHLFREPPQIKVGSALEIPLPDQSVDVVLCSRLLHHFPDAESRVQIFREFARVAKVGVV